MGNFSVSGVALKGIAACVPKKTDHNKDYPYLAEADISKLIEATGIEQRRIAPKEICTSDMCCAAAEKLIAELGWDAATIDVLIFVSQTPDYILPNTAPVLQDRLGLSKSTMAFDMTLGCSGYVYGLSVLAGIMKAAGFKKGLLLAGDTITKIASEKDKSVMPLFGDAGSATALELQNDAPAMHFGLGTDGSGYKTIIIPDGGARNVVTEESLKQHTVSEGIERNNCQLVLEGMDVFSFGITTVPKAVSSFMEHFSLQQENVDHFIFHQANMMMNKMIAKKLKLPLEKVPFSLKEFGNTSSATIPLTIVTALKGQLQNKKTSMVQCGFGVGLSWGTVYIETNDPVIPGLIEI